MGLKDVPVSSLTHLYFYFSSITPDSYSIAPMDGISGSLFSKFTNLKRNNPALKTVIAIDGWTFSDPGPTQKVFSDMVGSARARETFIDNLFSLLREYAFDGVDFGWEYPGALCAYAMCWCHARDLWRRQLGQRLRHPRH